MNQTHKLGAYAIVAVMVAAVSVGYYSATIPARQSGDAVADNTPAERTAPVAAVESGTIAITPIVSGQAATAIGASVAGSPLKVSWNASDFPSDTVSVSVLRKSGTDPIKYSLVRSISASTPNSGSIIWTPTAAELSGDIYLEVGCNTSVAGCQARILPISY